MVEGTGKVIRPSFCLFAAQTPDATQFRLGAKGSPIIKRGKG